MGESCAKREKSPTTWKIENCPYTYNKLGRPFINPLEYEFFIEFQNEGLKISLLVCIR